MSGGGPLPVREYQSADQLRRDAAALRARMFAPRPAPPPVSKPRFEPQVKREGFIPPKPAVPQDFNDLPAGRAARRSVKKNASHPMVRLMSRVARATGITVTDIRSDRRQANVVKARQILFYVARTLTTYSLPEIGRRSGGKDHTTVLHGVRRVQAVVDRLDIELPKSRVAMAKVLWAADWSERSK
ncbi:helix-turn-helix domain-containing protein [Methylobacterium sp. NPDC080182]|uniref:helix-turn-helix domain-containing protein n=1 Tax=Methylobacterium sp. NPDC080182 TaxID=3390590 RepID=UPI003CFE9FED